MSETILRSVNVLSTLTTSGVTMPEGIKLSSITTLCELILSNLYSKFSHLSSINSQRSIHKHSTYNDERHAEQLSHVEEHTTLEVNLYVFSVFYAETERKDVEKTQSVRFLYFCLPLSPETRRNVLKLVSMNMVKPLVGGTLLQRSAFFTVGSQLDIIKYVEVYAFW